MTRGWRGSVHCQPVFNAGSVLLSSLTSLSLSLPLDFLSFVLAFFRWQHLSSAFSPLSILSLSLHHFLFLRSSAFYSPPFLPFFFLFCSFFYFPLFSIASVPFEQGLLAKIDFRIPMLVCVFLLYIPIFLDYNDYIYILKAIQILIINNFEYFLSIYNTHIYIYFLYKFV